MKGRLFLASVLVVIAVGAGVLFTSGVLAQKSARTSASASSTPRMPDGKPDLSGVWARTNTGGFAESVEGENEISTFPSRRCGPTQKNCLEHSNQSYDGEFTGRFDPNRPLYKPEFWDKVQDLDYNTNFEDPIFHCQPAGVPRMGPPTRIVQTDRDVIFLYAASDAATAPSDFRIVPTDGRKHDAGRAQDVTFYGEAVGRWDGGTLVVDSVGFNDLTWLDRGGLFHSDNMHVIEKFRREGNTLFYDVTIEDPDVLLQPWVRNTRKLTLNSDPNFYIHEQSPCKETDAQIESTRVRH